MPYKRISYCQLHYIYMIGRVKGWEEIGCSLVRVIITSLHMDTVKKNSNVDVLTAS